MADKISTTSEAKFKYLCKYPGCATAYYTNSENKHFYTLPQKNPELLNSWLSAMQIPSSILNTPKAKNWRICEDHFFEKDFVNVTKHRLVFNAVPIPLKGQLEASNRATILGENIKSETENHVYNSITESKALNIVLPVKDVVINESTRTSISLPNKAVKVLQKPQVPNLVSNKKHQKDAYVDSAIDETKPTLDLEGELKSEVDSTNDFCGESLELNQICICCLKVTEVFTLSQSFVGNASILTLYEVISDIEVNEEEVPAMICQKCMRLLSRIDEFVKMLNHSHKVLMEAANSINWLKTLENDPETFNLKKSEIVHKALKEQSLAPLDDDMFQSINRRLQTETNMFQKKRVRSAQHTKRINKVSATTSDESFIEDKATCGDYCPFCCKTVRSFVRHSRYVHSVDWFTFRCLKCFFHNKLPEKLMEHCMSCGITIKQEHEVIISEKLDHVETDFNWYDNNENKTEGGHTLVTRDGIWLSDDKEEKTVGNIVFNLLINKKKKKFVCNKCKDFSSTEFDKVEEHVMDIHYNEKECILCSSHYTRFYAMVYHIKTAHGNRKCCSLCLINFKNDQEAEDHYKSEAHSTCQFCGRQFQNRRQLYRHWRIHDSTAKKKAGPFKCPECPKKYVSRNGVNKHIAVFHKNIRFLCDTCGQSYSSHGGLRLHRQSVHQGIRRKRINKVHLCETCGEDLSTNSRYKIEVHKAKHAGNNFVCRRCYASFPTKDLHEQHMNKLNHRLFECQICGATLVLPEAFRLHMEKNHGKSGGTGSISKLKTLKGWPCRYCSKMLKTKNSLQIHQRIHTGERPYKCVECNQAFIQLANMKKHRARHYKAGSIIQRKQFREKIF